MSFIRTVISAPSMANTAWSWILCSASLNLTAETSFEAAYETIVLC